ncbi:hypothetical protein A3E39_02635 [Candidatus Uhrbacteria bacterium RIFCSPHIGHO2_12_FULL_60_25]|uniref:Sodium/calcium exchanger membrane region domain-containing protein n=1 Tax=Candidatus Uhrbacteria bacterium RIFCSPHIGHO2_12_FULL_60_25 TaxID=1802399 RepID=A0A1F7UKV8_9BACT|nr:MAG: hypothetical protein A3D73_03835 [Candidatus Uhrbacteria bacterium RIFCSPHIGHO2_02_FULL_60_44]OGL78374.1 MAG: hypothetical protein A3E39_02635 [Candidatus Uhrbacteria bacterium RIFCSPHIGHO2_12_FULL_60_25]
MQSLLLLVAGIFVLAKSAGWLIDGALIIGRRYRLSPLFLGLTIVAAGTSAPEFAVNITAAARGLTGLSVGNVLGSNIANILLVLGIGALIYPIHVIRATVRIGIPLTLFATVFVLLLGQEHWGDPAAFQGIARLEGVMLLFGFPLYAFYEYGIGREARVSTESRLQDGFSLALIAVLAGIIGLAVSANLIVNAAGSIIARFNLSQELVGITLVAIGTSLPELATTVTAVMKRNHQLVVGNIIGSNLFNLLAVLGVSSIVNPLPFDNAQFEDLIFVGAASFVLWLVLAVQPRPALRRLHGVMFLVLYVTYLSYVAWRG